MQSADVEGLLRKGEIPVLRFLFGRLDTPAQAEELAQETLVRAFCALRLGARPADPLPWLLGIARHVLLETWRGERYRRQLQDQLSRTMGPGWAGSLDDVWVPGMATGSSFAGGETGPGWQDRVDRRILVAEALEDLPPELRAPVLLHYFADLPLAQVADHLGTTPGAVKMRLLRARLALRPKLKDEYDWKDAMSQTVQTAPIIPTDAPADGLIAHGAETAGELPVYGWLSVGMEAGGRRYVTEPLSELAFSGEVPAVQELRWAVERLHAVRLAGTRPLAGRLTFWAAPDPFEHPDPVEVWSLLRESTIGPPEFALVATDGWRLGTDPEWRSLLADLRDAGLHHVWLTFAGLEETHDALCGRRGAFAAAVRSLERASAVGLGKGANVIVSTPNLAQVDELLRLISSFRQDPSDRRGASVYVPHWSPFSPAYEPLRPEPEHLAALPPDLRERLTPAPFWSDPEAFTEAALTHEALEAAKAGAPEATELTASVGGLLVNARMDVLIRWADRPSVRWLRGLSALLGVATGMGLMMFVVAFGLGAVILHNPMVLTSIRWCGAGVLCWLAWKIATAHPIGASAGGQRIGFADAVAFQWVNPKSWLVCASAAAAFLDQGAGSALGQSAALGLTFVLAALPSCFPWLAIGAILQRYLRSERASRAFNGTMGALLVASVILFIR